MISLVADENQSAVTIENQLSTATENQSSEVTEDQSSEVIEGQSKQSIANVQVPSRRRQWGTRNTNNCTPLSSESLEVSGIFLA